MENYSIYLPNYTIGHNVYEQLGDVCLAHGKTAVVITGHKSFEAAGAKLLDACASAGIAVTDAVYYGGECSYANLDALRENPAVQGAELLFALGGGKVTDTTKALGEALGKPVFAFPTISSNCAACTSVSIMYNDDNSFLKPYFITKPPLHTFIDLDVIAAAPARYLWAGMGDTYAKYFEASMSSRGEELSHYVGLGVAISRMCLDPILAYGRKALSDNKAGIASPELENVVLAVNVTTALASILLTKDRIIDYNTGLAHAINYGLTSYPHVESAHLHGEIVSFGVLILLLVESQVNPAMKDTFEELYAFSKDTGLPTKLQDLDLRDTDRDAVIEKALAMKDIEHNPYPITVETLNVAFDTIQSM